ncbi:MAG: 50S ribosomal protein L11 methyltransferase, partial [Desulfobacterales bacterium]
MKWIEAKIIFDHQDKDLASDLISDIFYDFGLQGVVVEDPRIEPQDGWPENAIGRPDYYTIIGYLPDDDRIEKRCGILERKLGSIREKLGLIYRITYKELDEEDWSHSWKAYFHPL